MTRRLHRVRKSRSDGISQHYWKNQLDRPRFERTSEREIDRLSKLYTQGKLRDDTYMRKLNELNPQFKPVIKIDYSEPQYKGLRGKLIKALMYKKMRKK